MTVRRSRACWQTTLATIALLAFIAPFSTHAQTFTIIHTFTGGIDGATPYAGLTWDGRGNFYGTAAVGGYTGTTCYGLFGETVDGCGTVFRLHQSGGNWIFSTLYEFHGGTVDGNFPLAAVHVSSDGVLYGTTWAGHYNSSPDCAFVGVHPPHIGCGTIFNLRPPTTACTTALCSWTETILWAFPGPNQGGGAGPGLGTLMFDQAGNLYDTDFNGTGNAGEVFQLVPTAEGWMPGLTYDEEPGSDPDTPILSVNGVTMDAAGNVYTTSQMGSGNEPNCGYLYFNGCGTVFQLTPTPSGWSATVIYQFTGGADGDFPTAGLVADQAGNLYGVSGGGGANSGGVVFELTPSADSWTYHEIYALPDGNPREPYCFLAVAAPACNGPWGTLLMDSAGNLYGASYGNGVYGAGNVFKLTQSNGSWSYTDLYDFTGGNDGGNPAGSLIVDGNGNLYGTTVRGGNATNCFAGCGVVFEITQ